MKKIITLLLLIGGFACAASAADITRRIWAFCDWGGNWQSANNSIRIHYFKNDGGDITSWEASGSQYMTRFNNTNWFFYDITADESALASVRVIIRANSGDAQTGDSDVMDLVNKNYKLKVEYADGNNRATVSELHYYLLNTSTSQRTEMTTADCCTFTATIDNQTAPGTDSYVVAPSFAFSDNFSETYWGLVFRPWAEHQNLAFENVSDRSFFAEDNNNNAWHTNSVPVKFELSLNTLTWKYAISPYIERTLNSAAEGYATFSSAYDVIPGEGLTAQYASAVDASGSITWTDYPSTGIAANQGALLIGTAGSTYKFTPATSASAPSTNFLEPIIDKTQLAQTEGGKTNYILTKVGSGPLAFYKVNANGSWCAAGTAYLSTTAPTPSRGYFSLEDEDATAIEGIANENNINLTVYDLQGRRVTSPQKGLYIVNGKKVVIK